MRTQHSQVLGVNIGGNIPALKLKFIPFRVLCATRENLGAVLVRSYLSADFQNRLRTRVAQRELKLET